MRFWKPLRKRRTLRMHGLTQVEVRGQEHLHNAIAAGHGVLITPNHPTHADPFLLLEVCDQLATPFYFMTAWQVFAMTHWLGRQVLRQHGAFSINREGHDLRSLRHAVSLLEQRERPLVIFPEGEVFHLNDRATHFRKGAATIALRAAHRSDRPVACIPCGMKYQYVDDPMPQLLKLMGRLEQRMGWQPAHGMPLVKRIHRVGVGVLTMKEVEYFGTSGEGSPLDRTNRLMFALLGRLEDRYAVFNPKPTVPERIKQLRRAAILRMESSKAAEQQQLARRDLDDLFFVNQLYSYPAGYLADNPSIERIAETLDKMEEDVLHVRSANRRGALKGVVSFGEPVMAEPFMTRQLAAETISATLQQRVQLLLDEINGPSAMPDSRFQPQPRPDDSFLNSAAELQIA